MKRWGNGILAALLCIGLAPAAARAESEVDILLDKLVEKQVLTSVEAGLIRREIAETKETRNKQLAKEIVPDSARNWKWAGDIRLRNEYRNKVGTGNDRNRQRIRFRYGAEGKIADDLKVKFRVATGASTTGGTTGDPVSTNQSFDRNFAKANIALDLAQLTYSPQIEGVDKVEFIGGIMENPMWTVTPMVWDGDLTMDGVAAKIEQGVGPVKLFANAGAFSLDTDETESAALFTAQGGASIMPFEDADSEAVKNLKFTAAAAYHDYTNVASAAEAGTDIIARESQNTTTKDFNQLNPSGEIATKVGGVPVAVFGDWVRNVSTGSGTNSDDGFAIGAKAGKASKPFSLKEGWEAGYFYQELEANAAFDEFTDSDFNDGGTNAKGHKYWVTLAVLKNSTVGLTYIRAHQLTGAKTNEDRLQADWVTKF